VTSVERQSAEIDRRWMEAALRLAERGLGVVWPNPAVGCIIVKDGRVVGRGWTQPGGRPHAETEALRRAGEQARGSTAYVSLEPCVHHGATPPCTEALIAAGVERIVIAAEDPDPRVSGRGMRRLAEQGIRLTCGVMEAEAIRLNQGFFLRCREKRPLFTFKAATSLDGRIATRTGASQWISGEAARAWAHRLRATHDGILVGSGTALADDPALTCRLPGLGSSSPVRIIADGRLRLPLDAQVVRTARQTPTWVLTLPGNIHRHDAYTDHGVVVIEVDADASGRMAPTAIAAALAARGLTRILIEGGGTIVAAFLKAGLVDEVVWCHAPLIIGGDGIPAARSLDADALDNTIRFDGVAAYAVGEDVFAEFRRGH
jgi:diaminohydroxyphosphoribosylaminopyrimidine deaminase/5-amino-6-(5-phosphoribosylamino)uracil reductase